MKIPGIYVEIRGDSTQLRKDIAQARQSVTEQARGMSNALNNALSGQQVKNSVNSLVTNLGTLSRSSQVAEKAFDNISVDLGEMRKLTGLSEAQLDKLQRQMLKTKAAAAQERALKNIAKAAGLSADEIRDLGLQMKVSSAAIDKVVNATNKSAKSMNGLKDSAQQTKATMGDLVAKIGAVTGGIVAIGTVARGSFNEFKTGLKAVEDFNLTVASSAAFITTFSERAKQGDLAGAFKEAHQYAKVLAEKLEQIDAQTVATGKDLQTISETMVQYGVLLDINNKKQVQGFQNIANALALTTAGQNKDIQMRQEINALLMGQVRATDRLAKLLKAIDPELESHLKKWKQEGTLIENVGELLGGFAASTKEIENLWTAVGSTMDTIHKRVLRGALEPAYRDLIDLAKDFNKSMVDAEGELTPRAVDLQESIDGTYQTAKKLIKEYGEEVATFTGLAVAAKVAQLGLNAAIKANPYVTAAAGIMLMNQGLKHFDLDIGSLRRSLQDLNGPLSEMMAVFKGEKDWNTGEVITEQQKILDQIKELERQISVQLSDGDAWYDLFVPKGPERTQKNIDALRARIADLRAELEQLNSVGKEGKIPTDNTSSVIVPKVKPVKTEDVSGLSDKALNKALRKEFEALKAFNEKKNAIVKAGLAQSQQLNEQYYDWGIKSLSDYLAEKHRISLANIDLEVATAKREVAAAQKALKSLQPETDKDGKPSPGKDRVAKAKAEKDLYDAQKKLVDLEGKRAVLSSKNANETKNALYGQSRAYQQLGIDLLSLTGQTIAAQEAQNALYLSSKEYFQLEQEAATGSVSAIQALADVKERMAVNDRLVSLEYQEQLLDDKIAVEAITGAWDDYYQTQVEILKTQIAQAEATGQQTGALKAQLREAEKMTSAMGAFDKGFSDIASEWADTAANMAELGEDIAQSMHDSFSDLFFDALEGDFKDLSDYAQAMLSSINRALADSLASGFLNSSGIGSLGNTMGSGLAGLIGMLFHDGGVVGRDQGPVRSVPVGTFDDAKRYHTGLMPDEFPAILQRGEAVFTKEQLKALGFGSQQGGQNISVNVPINIDDTTNKQMVVDLQQGIEDTVTEILRRHM